MKTMPTMTKLRSTAKRVLLCTLTTLTLTLPALGPSTAQAQGPYLADLWVTGISDYYDTPGHLDPTHVWVWVRNDGTSNSSKCNMTFTQWMGGPNWKLLSNIVVPAMHPNQLRGFVVPTPINIHVESKVFRFTVDSNFEVNELRETNNAFTVNNL